VIHEDKLLSLIPKSEMNRRTFLKSCGSLLILWGLPIQMRDIWASGTEATAIPDHITLSWVSDPKTTQTITWRTATAVANGIVEISPGMGDKNASATSKTFTAQLETLQSSLGNMNLFSATLTGLKPGMIYNYRVGDGSNWSPMSTFVTEQAEVKAFKFLIFGDSQSGNANNPEYGPWKTTAQNAFAANPDARFFINVGDLVEDGQNYLHWNNWYLACTNLLHKIPAMPAQGNHETYNTGWLPPSGSASEPYEFVHQFKVPQNGPTGLKGQVYSWDYGNVHFAVIDSQSEEEAADTIRFSGTSFLDRQKAWLDNDLKSTKQPWKIVIFHKTPYYNKATRTNEIIKAAFTPIIDKYHVDVVFNGHDHGISRTYPMKNDTFAATPAAGTIYYVTGRSGNKYYTDLSRKVWDQYFYDSVDMPSYTVAQVKGNTLTLTAYKQNGTVLDTYTISKSGLDTPATLLPIKSSNTQVVVYGNTAAASTALLKDNQWYVSLDVMKINNIGGTYSFDAASGQATISLADKVYIFTIGSNVVDGIIAMLDNPVILENAVPMIAANDLITVWGFRYNYDSSFNLLYITK
jgi:3',5'-cyclic AMP phosphodiesterase CpdA